MDLMGNCSVVVCGLLLGIGIVLPTALCKRQHNDQHSCRNNSSDCERRVWTCRHRRQQTCYRFITVTFSGCLLRFIFYCHSV